MTKQNKPKSKKPLKFAEFADEVLAVIDPKFLARRKQAEKDYKLTIFLPAVQVSIRRVTTDGKETSSVMVREAGTNGGRNGRWRYFHNASTTTDRTASGSHVGITAPLSAWHAVSLRVANRVIGADLPGGADYKPKQDATTAAFVAGRKKEKAA